MSLAFPTVRTLIDKYGSLRQAKFKYITGALTTTQEEEFETVIARFGLTELISEPPKGQR